MPTLQPRYTIDMLDELRRDETMRYELVDGVLLVTAAPGPIHAAVCMRLLMVLGANVPESVARIAPPGEVRVGEDTDMIPDILLYPGSVSLDTPWKEVPEWWLGIEVVSRSSAVYDREYKRRAYLAAGLMEYWVVDPSARSVEVWRPGDREAMVARDRVAYVTPDGEARVDVDLEAIFRDIPRIADR